MEKTVTKEKTVTMQVPEYTQLTCDVCGKLIYIIKDKDYIYHKGYYWEVAVGHHDWGNDSVDSYEYPDICSNECVKKFVDEYLSKSNGTEFLNMERHNHYPVDKREDWEKI